MKKLGIQSFEQDIKRISLGLDFEASLYTDADAVSAIESETALDVLHSNLVTVNSDDHHTRYTLTDDLTSGEISQLQNINLVTISNTQWGYLGALDQSLTTTNVATFSKLFVNDTDNSNMTTGVTINQGSANDEIISLKSSDITHGVTNQTETDTFFAISKADDLTGGTFFKSFSENVQSFLTWSIATSINTDKLSSANAAIEFSGQLANGSGTQMITSNGNIFAIKNRFSTKFLVDAEGDFYYDGVDGGAFDKYDDISLLRAFARITSRDIIKTEFDRFVEHKESDLIRLGILGDTIGNGGLVNGSQVQRLLVGATWQLETKIRRLQNRLKKYDKALLGAGIKLPA